MSSDKIRGTRPPSRYVAGSALVGAAMLPKLAHAQGGLGPAGDLLTAVRKFLAGLDLTSARPQPLPGTRRSGATGTISAGATTSSRGCGWSR